MIKVYDKDKQEKVIYLQLVETDDSVELQACDSTGVVLTGGYLLEISRAGIVRNSGIAPSIGFVLENGKLPVLV